MSAADTLFPLTSLVVEQRELGLVVAVLLGFGFGFVLERAGFGQAPNLAAQFYLRDMRVFKVMFTAIITAMIGLVGLSGVGLADLRVISEGAASFTYLWPMIVGGFLLGMGFIVSGYCPGTSVVATASGNLDGAVTFLGVIVGSVMYGQVQAASATVAAFHDSGNKEFLFLYDLLGLPPAVLALLVTAMALSLFLGAEQVEKIMARRRGEEPPAAVHQSRPRRLAMASLGLVALLGVATLALPQVPAAATKKPVVSLSPEALARRVIEKPWTLRILDIRQAEACGKKTVPGAECAPAQGLDGLGLGYGSGGQDLVLVADGALKAVPAAALAYPGRVFTLAGGFAAWSAYALRKPVPPAPGASTAVVEAYRFRAALYGALTGAAPPPAPVGGGGVKVIPAKKKGGGGCGG